MTMVPMVWALRSAGHEVLVAGQEDVVRAAEAAGLPSALLGDRSGDSGRRTAPGHLGGGRAVQHGGAWDSRWETLGKRWLGRADAVLDDYLALGRRWRPDLVLCDPIEFSGLIAGGVLGVPVVFHRYGPDLLTTQALEAAREILRPVAVEAGLAALPEPALIIDPCPPGLQHPEASPARPMRYLPYNGTGALPGWRSEGSERVLISLGTRSLDLEGRGDVLATALRACEGLQTVVTCIPEHQEALRAQAPASVRIVDPVPLHLIMDGFDCLVNHGGGGTFHTALYYGVPQVLVAADHPVLRMSGERLAEYGAGRMVPAEQCSAEQVREAVLDVLRNPAYRAAAGRLRAEMAAQPSPAELVGTLLSLAG
ncbi:nucleotide disphospho-sugar-binding domain-containing protein [Streptomyces sp. NPDC052396]|uniref:nucleotide disphospho-sugar-binding domain-containing protein n=1 Tax=Streptomyces sp. NPDC052396 TaxID=3365689 RepID=UPI0037D2441B